MNDGFLALQFADAARPRGAERGSAEAFEEFGLGDQIAIAVQSSIVPRGRAFSSEV
jgi:hypothetical protein